MPKRVAPLTDLQISKAKAKATDQKLSDGGGLFLLIPAQKFDGKGKALPASKLWRMKYVFAGKEKALYFGSYPEVTLADARQVREDTKAALKKGVDPGAVKSAMKAAQPGSGENSFEVIAREWFKEYKHTWSDGHAVTIMSRMENNIFPYLGARPVSEIEPPEVLEVLRRVKARGALESAHRIRTIFGQVFRYAIATGRARRDVAADLKGALPPAISTNFAAITNPDELGQLLRTFDSYQGTPVVRAALQLAPLVFVRPGELRHAEWKEFDLEAATWDVPIERLKLSKIEKAKRKGQTHLVPLSLQAVEILRDLKYLTGRSTYVFTGGRSYQRCMSENAVLGAMRRMGYDKDMITGHGFRATARTMIRERLHIEAEFIEIQLAHKTKAPNGTAYDRVAFLKERRQMMQAWADYLDQLKSSCSL